MKVKKKKFKKTGKTARRRRRILVYPPKFSGRKLRRMKRKTKKQQNKKKIKKRQSLKKKIIRKKASRKFNKIRHILKRSRWQSHRGSTIKSGKNQQRKIKKLKSKIAIPKESFFKAKIKVVGIGGGGSSIVSEIGRSLNKATFVIADTDIRAFKKRRGIKYFLFGQEQTHGLGTGLNPLLAKSAAEQDKEEITKLFEGQDIVILVACLGGGVWSGAAQVFAQALPKNFSGIIFGIFTLPFKFEGKNKYKIAYKSLKILRKSLNVSITIPNEKIFKVIDSNTAITDAFSAVNRNLIESLESLIDLIYSPGVINIDFADLRTILKGRGNLAFLNTAQASGKNRAEKIIQEILYNPLYQNSNFTSEKVLFNISGSSNLSMFEVDKITRLIADQNPKAKIIFGISKNSKYKNKIKATVLMTGSSITSEIEKPKVKIKPYEKVKKIVKIAKSKKEKNKPSLSKSSEGKEKIPFEDTLMPVFNNVPVDLGLRKLSVIEPQTQHKNPVRRTALEIKKAEEIEENKKSVQEKEWEIPAFLRLKK